MRHSRLFIVTFGIAFTVALTALAQDGPPPGGPGAQPGQCFGRTVRAPVISEHVRREQVSRGSWGERSVPALYRTDVRRVLVHPARVERTRYPAIYRTVERVSYAPGPSRWVRTPPEWRTERRQVLITPAHAEWRRQPPHFAYADAAPGQTIVQPTGEVLCRVWCPARYGSVERRVMVSRGGSYRVRGPDRRIVSRQRVLVRAAGVSERRIAAVYRTVSSERLVRPARHERFRIAPTYRTVVERRAHGGGAGWSQVLCAGPLSPQFRAQMQGALNARGYDAGPPDGGERPQTYDALRRFQRDHRLPEGQVTVESADALGVLPR